MNDTRAVEPAVIRNGRRVSITEPSSSWKGRVGIVVRHYDGTYFIQFPDDPIAWPFAASFVTPVYQRPADPIPKGDS